MKCVKCGAEIQTGQKFCRFCGTPAPENEPVKEKKTHQKKKPVVAILVSVIVVLAILCVVAFWKLSKIDKEQPVVQEEPVQEAPVVMEEPQITEIVLPKPTVINAKSDNYGSFSYRIPELYMGEKPAEDINAIMYETLNPYLDQVYENISDGVSVFISGIDYSWSFDGEVVSILAWVGPYPGDWTEYHAWNILAETGELLSTEAVVQHFGMDLAEFEARALEVMAENVGGGHMQNLSEDMYKQGLEATCSRENLEKVRPFINADGRLCIAAEVEVFAGAGMYYYLYDLETGERDYSGHQDPIPEPEPEPESQFPADSLWVGDEITITAAVVKYSDEPSDIGSEYCFFDVEAYNYVYEDMDGNLNGYHAAVYFTRGDATELLKPYIGQTVTVRGTFGTEIHGIPYIDQVVVLEGTKAPVTTSMFHTGYAAYDQKLEEYAAAAAMDDNAFREKYDNGMDCSSINAMILDFNVSVYYALHDVDGNGIEELLISDGHSIIDFYLLCDGKLDRPIWNDSLGYRAHLQVLADGRLRMNGSGGAASGSCEVYRIMPDGRVLTEEAFYWADDTGRSDMMDATHIYLPGEEAYALLDSHEVVDLESELLWLPVYEQ